MKKVLFIFLTTITFYNCTTNEAAFGLTKGIRFNELESPHSIEVIDNISTVTISSDPNSAYIYYASEDSYKSTYIEKIKENLRSYGFTVVSGSGEFKLTLTSLSLKETIEQETYNAVNYNLSNVRVAGAADLIEASSGKDLYISSSDADDYERVKEKNNGDYVEKKLDANVFIDLLDRMADKVAGKSSNAVNKHFK